MLGDLKEKAINFSGTGNKIHYGETKNLNLEIFDLYIEWKKRNLEPKSHYFGKNRSKHGFESHIGHFLFFIFYDFFIDYIFTLGLLRCV